MNEISLPEEENLSASEDALPEESAANKKIENEGVIPGNKAAKKNTSKVTGEPAKVAKSGGVKDAKEVAKKASPKKLSEKKVETVIPENVKSQKKAAAKKATEKAIKTTAGATGKKQTEPEAQPVKLPKTARTAQPAPPETPLETPARQQVEDVAEAPLLPQFPDQLQATGEAEAVTNNAPVDSDLNENTPVQLAPETASALRRITFHVRFHTVFGQSLSVSANHPLFGNDDPALAHPLSCLNEEYWFGTMEIPVEEPVSTDISYHYVFKDTDGTTTVEWNTDRVIKTTVNAEELIVIDTWNPSSSVENTYYTEPFREVLLKENFTAVETRTPKKVTHIFRAKAPLLAKGQALCIIGAAAELGQWDTTQPLLLSREPKEVWHSISLDLSTADFPLLYKYGLFDVEKNTFVEFESGSNRVLSIGVAGKLTIVSDGFASIPNKGFHGAGVAIPVFSLRSANSFGVGEFSDLKLMVDWAKQVGLKLVQLLPVNDTTATHSYTDSYPYAAISAFALHPLYLHLPAIVNKENQHLLTSLQDKQVELNSRPEVDYVGVMSEKWDLLKTIFPSQKEVTFISADFTAFFEENAHWLVPYAAFSYFREQNKTADFNQWESHQKYDAEQIASLAGVPMQTDEAISIYYYIQYHLHLQLKDAASYAHQNGIIVKGDIPIGIYRNSCDAWQEPELFCMEMQAGAPPDDFAVKGQNWGFPTYNWHRMREDGFSWWKKRFTQMSYYFDAFRIDHILGFFRIWSIPMDAVEGIMGHFVPAVPLHIDEIIGRGISFPIERFSRPYITDAVLHEFLRGDHEIFTTQFLNHEADSTYTLKPAFDTQRKVELYFSDLHDNDENRHFKEVLFNLVSNLLLLEVKNSEGQRFHFRIAMADTPSFKHLDTHTQYQLQELYVNYFFRRQDSHWRQEAMMKLPELKRSTNMLICGEDLGMVPASVPGVMKELAILSLEIQRMPKNPVREFFHPNDAPYLSVVTPSTHDMSTIRGWWEEDRAATQRFFNSELGQWGTAPYFCEPWINRIIVLQHLYSPAMWSIFQLQDLLGLSAVLRRENPHEERINVPANPKHYWRYRMHIPLEQLLQETEFITDLKRQVLQSGR